MASIKRLSRLFSALAQQDIPRAEEAAADIARDEEERGHHSAARLLNGSLHPNSKSGSVSRGGTPDQPTYARLLSEALSQQIPTAPLSEVSIRRDTRDELQAIVKEWRSQSGLQAAGIPRRSRLLFHGPPGCGKSLTAKALGQELSLPTYIVRFDGVIGAYLGQTAIHLRELFRFAERSPCVLVFDEVDALGKRRGSLMDVGELDRIVIAFMQELEHSAPAGIVIATSNLPAQLDPALWRRFDLVLEFPAPSRRELTSFIARLANRYGITYASRAITRAKAAKSYAEAERLIQAEARSKVLAGCEKGHA